MRKKEGLADYRYFPEPDLPPLHVAAADVEALRASMPELPAQMRARLLALGLPQDVVLLLAEDAATAAYLDACVAAGADAVQAANWIQRDIMGWCKEQGVRYDPPPGMTLFRRGPVLLLTPYAIAVPLFSCLLVFSGAACTWDVICDRGCR